MSRPGGFKHARRLSLFGIGSGDGQNQSEGWTRGGAVASDPLAMSMSSMPSSKNADLSLRRTSTNVLSRTSSKKLLKKGARPGTSPLDAKKDDGKEKRDQALDTPSITKQKSFKVRVAVSLSTLFVPKPRKKVLAVGSGRKDPLGGLDGIGYYCRSSRDTRNDDEETETRYTYISRSPSPPSPNIRPPSGLGRAAESIDLEAYVREERERSLRASSLFAATSPVSRTPSHTASPTYGVSHTPSTLSPGTPQTNTPATSVSQCLESKSTLGRDDDDADVTVESICLKFPSPPPSPAVPTLPRPSLVQAIKYSSNYCALRDLPALALANRAFIQPARIALYAHVDDNDLPERDSDVSECGGRLDRSRRRLLLSTLHDNEHLASLVNSFRWTCSPSASLSSLSPSGSISSQQRSIPRRAPIVSISASSEEQVLPRVIARLPNITALHLVHPPPSFLLYFLPSSATASPIKSSRTTPIPSPCPSPSPCASLLLPADFLALPKLEELSLSGRTTVSTSFSALLVRFLERHPDIHNLSLPDVFCLPIPVTASPRRLSPNSSHSSLSSPKRSSGEPVPPVPPLPSPLLCSSLSINVRKDSMLPILPNLTKLTAPLTLAKQLVPGRPLRLLDIELATSVFEGLRPAEIARCLASANFDKPAISPTSSSQGHGISSPVSTEGSTESVGGAGKSPSPVAGGKHLSGASSAVDNTRGVKVLRIRCTAKVDGRTVGRVLNAIGTELGTTIETLGLGWTGNDQELYTQLSLAVARFRALENLDIFHTKSDVESEAVQTRSNQQTEEEGILAEQKLVEQWSRLCPALSRIDFPTGRVWKAK